MEVEINMSSLNYLQKWKSSIEAYKKVEIPSDYEIKRIQDCVEGLFTFAKFKIGQKVKMAATYPVNERDSWGWMAPYRHLFKSGSKATIRKVDWYDGNFNYGIEFDSKTYIDREGNIHPHDSTSVFTISEKWLKAAK